MSRIMNRYEKYMSKALKLAQKGLGRTSPNPAVGAVIVKDDRIIGEGYHSKAGKPHAEIVAINNAKDAGYSLKGAEIFITLEPCCHYGKTPPCTQAIIENNFKRVVYAIDDPNPLVGGKSMEILEKAGIEVVNNVLADEARWLLSHFRTYMEHCRAFIAVKYASSLDGRIATKTGDSKWISSSKSRDFVHSLRNRYDAIAIGANTLRNDNPRLTVRRAEGRNPVRIVIVGKRKIQSDYTLFNDKKARTIVATFHKNPFRDSNVPEDIELWHLSEKLNGVSILELAQKAYQNKLSSILIEGGGDIITSALDERVVDRLYLVFAPKIIGAGIEAIGDIGIRDIKSSIDIKIREQKQSGGDIIIIGTPVYES